MKRFLLITLALVGLTLGTIGVQSSTVFAADSNAKTDVCTGIDATGGSTGCKSSGPTVESVIRTVANTLSAIVGIIAVIMIIIAGLQYVTSNGESGKIQSAKNSLIYALVGIAVVALSQSLVLFVVNKVTTSK